MEFDMKYRVYKDFKKNKKYHDKQLTSSLNSLSRLYDRPLGSVVLALDNVKKITCKCYKECGWAFMRVPNNSKKNLNGIEIQNAAKEAKQALENIKNENDEFVGLAAEFYHDDMMSSHYVWIGLTAVVLALVSLGITASYNWTSQNILGVSIGAGAWFILVMSFLAYFLLYKTEAKLVAEDLKTFMGKIDECISALYGRARMSGEGKVIIDDQQQYNQVDGEEKASYAEFDRQAEKDTDCDLTLN
jgi:hypothetical protein